MLIEIEKSGRYRNSNAIELLGLCVLFLHMLYEGYLKSLLRITLSILVGGWQGRGYDCQVLGCTRFCSSTLGR